MSDIDRSNPTPEYPNSFLSGTFGGSGSSSDTNTMHDTVVVSGPARTVAGKVTVRYDFLYLTDIYSDQQVDGISGNGGFNNAYATLTDGSQVAVTFDTPSTFTLNQGTPETVIFNVPAGWLYIEWTESTYHDNYLFSLGNLTPIVVDPPDDPDDPDDPDPDPVSSVGRDYTLVTVNDGQNNTVINIGARFSRR